MVSSFPCKVKKECIDFPDYRGVNPLTPVAHSALMKLEFLEECGMIRSRKNELAAIIIQSKKAVSSHLDFRNE
jgi:hypothetical protein